MLDKDIFVTKEYLQSTYIKGFQIKLFTSTDCILKMPLNYFSTVHITCTWIPWKPLIKNHLKKYTKCLPRKESNNYAEISPLVESYRLDYPSLSQACKCIRHHRLCQKWSPIPCLQFFSISLLFIDSILQEAKYFNLNPVEHSLPLKSMGLLIPKVNQMLKCLLDQEQSNHHLAGSSVILGAAWVGLFLHMCKNGILDMYAAKNI